MEALLLFIVVGVDVTVRNIKRTLLLLGKQRWVTFALLSGSKIFRTAANSNKY